MRFAVDHLRVDAVNGRKLRGGRSVNGFAISEGSRSVTHIVDELAFGLGHGGKNLYPLVGRHEPGFIQIR